MSERGMQLSEAFVEIGEFADSKGATPLNQHEGCWESDVDGIWWIALNGHSEGVVCSRGITVEPFNCYVEFNDWPAGHINPFGGVLVAGGAANEDSFIEALQAAQRKGGTSD